MHGGWRKRIMSQRNQLPRNFEYPTYVCILGRIVAERASSRLNGNKKCFLRASRRRGIVGPTSRHMSSGYKKWMRFWSTGLSCLLCLYGCCMLMGRRPTIVMQSSDNEEFFKPFLWGVLGCLGVATPFSKSLTN